MAEVWTMGEILVEIMRKRRGAQLYEPEDFSGPYPSGAPAICIDTVAKLGHTAGIIGGVGADDFGKCLLDRFEQDGVDTRFVLRSDKGATACAFVTYFEDDSRKFIFHIGDTPAVRAKAPDLRNEKDAKYFHIMGCSLMADAAFAGEIIKTMHAFKALGAEISFDPNIRPELLGNSDAMGLIHEVLGNCSVLMPGMGELLMITGKPSVEEAVAACFERPAIKIIAVKDGSRGCKIYTRDETVKVGIYPVTVKDETGAGDCFDAAFLCGLIDGKPIRDIARQASVAAALNTAEFGPMEGKMDREVVDRLALDNHWD